MKQDILNQIKNVYGWKTKRKIVVFSVDDYGNVRLDSRRARERMDHIGMKVLSRFDAYDSLETREDLEYLYETLTSVKDLNGNPAIFTPFSTPCNIDFEAVENENYERYSYENLPQTYEKLASRDREAYKGAWVLWKQGIKEGLMRPQFHGREHLNLKVFEEKLGQRDFELMNALKNRSYTSISYSGYPTISITAAFDFHEMKENDRFEEIIVDGLNQFEKVYGYRSTHFNPPGGREHPIIHYFLKQSGIKYLDTPLLKREHQGEGNYRKIVNYTGKKNELGMIYQVRNVVFEPTDDRGFEWVQYALKQIEAAFFWNRPAIVSSHRVNFCGHIDPRNRKMGLSLLGKLLKSIVQKWPGVEFMSSDQLGDVIRASKHH